MSYYNEQPFVIERTGRAEWTVYRTDDKQRLMSFPTEDAANRWIRHTLRDLDRALPADALAAVLIDRIDRMESLWRKTPPTFAGLHVFADVMNRLKNLRAECQKQLNGSRKAT